MGLTYDLIHNQVFNVGINEENYRICELAEIAKDTVPGSRIEYANGAEPDKRSYRVDFSKISRTLPKFKPQWNALLCIEESVNTGGLDKTAQERCGVVLHD